MEENYIPYAQPCLDNNDKLAILKCLDSNWLSTGILCKQFEQQFIQYIGSKYALSVSSCTAALHLSLKVIGIKEGDEVIVPSFTFVSTINAIEYCGGKPIFADVSEATLCIDHTRIEKLVTSKTKAIIAVHYGAHSCEMDSINDIAKRNNLKVVEDAAHALGSSFNNKKIGNSDNLVCFSFYATKNITTGEGGMITTNNKDYLEEIEKMRLHGMSKNAWDRYSSSGTNFYDVELLGFKYNLPDILASLGISQIKKIDQLNEKRKLLYKRYDKELKKIEGINLLKSIECNSSFYMFPILVSNEQVRNELIEYLRINNIGSAVLFNPVNEFTFYKNKYGVLNHCPISKSIGRKILSLPLFPDMSFDQQTKIIEILKEFFNSVYHI
ncbi:DegT/DnrJ/EryC1/StrS aminotransferase family protein [Listeria welshimeri]|nr:DegT/DnrJ/EryC1/StrS aminotransferase family protein [Listeria welshimeri]